MWPSPPTKAISKTPGIRRYIRWTKENLYFLPRWLLRELMSKTRTTEEKNLILQMPSLENKQIKLRTRPVGRPLVWPLTCSPILKKKQLRRTWSGERNPLNNSPGTHSSLCPQTWIVVIARHYSHSPHTPSAHALLWLYLPEQRALTPTALSIHPAVPWLYTSSHEWDISMVCPAVISNSSCPHLLVTCPTDFLYSALLFLSAD